MVAHGYDDCEADLLARVQRQPGWQERWDIDFYRLRHLLDQMDAEHRAAEGLLGDGGR